MAYICKHYMFLWPAESRIIFYAAWGGC